VILFGRRDRLPGLSEERSAPVLTADRVCAASLIFRTGLLVLEGESRACGKCADSEAAQGSYFPGFLEPRRMAEKASLIAGGVSAPCFGCHFRGHGSFCGRRAPHDGVSQSHAFMGSSARGNDPPHPCSDRHHRFRRRGGRRRPTGGYDCLRGLEEALDLGARDQPRGGP
jgi:hypothetical protein